jgi:hypothetical protein
MLTRCLLRRLDDIPTETCPPGHSIHSACLTRIAGGFETGCLSWSGQSQSAHRVVRSQISLSSSSISRQESRYPLRDASSRVRKDTAVQTSMDLSRTCPVRALFCYRLPTFIIIFGSELQRCGVSRAKENIERRARLEVIRPRRSRTS